MIITSKQHRQLYQEATALSVDILWQLYQKVAVGVYPIEIDQLAFALCRQHGVQPNFAPVKNQRGQLFGHATCIHRNDVVVHGVPESQTAIMDGDLVTVDFGLTYQGLQTDHCFSVGVGRVSAVDQCLLTIGREAVLLGVNQAVVGRTTADIGAAIETHVQKAGYDTVKEYVGHGIGKTLHDAPEVPAAAHSGRGTMLDKGMVLCIEAQVVAGEPQIKTDVDGWTVRTRDGSHSVMFEYMVVVDRNHPQILTDTIDWPVLKS